MSEKPQSIAIISAIVMINKIETLRTYTDLLK